MVIIISENYNKEFAIYDLDTNDSIINRIASELDTLPRFLYFPDFPDKVLNAPNTSEIIVEDLFSIIKHTEDFEELFQNIKDKAIKLGIKTEEIVKIYFNYNDSIQKMIKEIDPEYLDTIILSKNDEIKNITGDNIDITKIIEGNDKTIYEKYIKQNKKLATEKEEEFKKFEGKKGIEHEPFELEERVFEIRMIEKTIDQPSSILEIFNNIRVTDDVPFASCSDFYKIRVNHVPSLDWNNSTDNITLKVSQRNIFTDITISIDELGLKADLSYNIKNTVSEDALIKKYTSVLQKDYTLSEPKEKSIKGVFYFPNQRINKYIFIDMVLNNKEFSQYICIDEHIIASRDSIYVYFNTKESGLVTALLTEQIVDKNNNDMKKDVFIANSYCIRVKISKADNITSIKKFKDVLSKLFTIYNSEYNRVYNIYNKFIPENELEMKHNLTKELNETRGVKFKDNLAPEIYAPNYTSFCGNPPTLIRDDEVEKYKEDNYQVLAFPKKDNKEGIKSSNYICEYPKYKYPGVRVNTLSNADKFEYLPCCYIKNQKMKVNYRRYYEGEDITNVLKKNILTSNKLVDNGQLGYLPQEIEKFFNIIDDDINSIYRRHGVNRSKNSFLECVLFSLDSNDKSDIENIRKTLATDELISACNQEMFDYTDEDIIRKIENTDEYFDPKMFIHLLEIKYKCNIILFRRDENNPDGALIIPRHTKGYFKTITKFEKCIFIYENSNNDTEQCELICKWNTDKKQDDLTRNFEYDSFITKKALDIFYNLNEFYMVREKISYINFTIPNSTIISQTIDNNGKTRKINIQYKGKTITIFTSPLQPYAVKKLPYFENLSSIISETDINQFLVEIDAKYITKSNNKISCKIGDVNAFIYINKIGITSSYIVEYNKYKKLSRYITQYFFWLYSKCGEDIDVLKREYIKFDSNFEYGNVSNKFSMNEKGIMENNKLVLKSQEVFDRLYYLLKIYTYQNPIGIRNYSSRILIDNYYIDISDFDTYDHQVIIHGEDSLNKFILSDEQNEIQYIIQDEIQFNITTPYLFKNILIDNTVYLAQNTQTIENAINIYKNWKTNKYNIMNNIDENDSKITGFVFYAYKNKNTIEKYYIRGDGISLAKIVGYKVYENDYEYTLYTVLLPIGNKIY